jgi:PIN domain-containing protein
MRIFFDENFSHFLADGIAHIQNGRKSEGIDVFHIANFLGKGVPDEDWIPKIAKMHGVIITQDININRTRHLNSLCNKYKIGMFFFKSPSKKGYTYWEWVEQVIARWCDIKKLSIKTKRPFSYIISPRSLKIKEL